jgi:transposase
MPLIKQPKVLGVDDWAYRKGINYGTILIDMETSRPIDILPSRESKDLKEWLSKYPDIEIATRDRSSSYSSAIDEICPEAVQVADRFHLLMNLSDALDKYFKSKGSEIRKIIKEKTNEILNVPDSHDASKKKDKSSQVLSEGSATIDIKVDQRQVTFSKVKELQELGFSIRKISRDLGVARSTVHSYFQQVSLPPRTHSRSTNIELFASHIVNRLCEKGYMIKNIIDEIYKLGYTGSRTQAYHNINTIKENFKIDTPDYTQVLLTKIPYVKPLNSRKLAKYIGVCLNAIEEPDEQKYLKTLLDNIPEFKVVRKLVQIFKTMLKRGCGNIRRWIDFVKRSKYKPSGLITFANGLLRDIKAVENGINMKWSNGAVEGHVNRIKSIKRQMYGRASFDLLRKKVILSQTG